MDSRPSSIEESVINHAAISPENDRVLRKREVIEIIGVSDTTLWRTQHQGEFTRPICVTSLNPRAQSSMQWIQPSPTIQGQIGDAFLSGKPHPR